MENNNFASNFSIMQKLSPHKFLEKGTLTPIIDVRSPAEFEEGHIPGAINIPIFSNDERAIVGTLYKQKGKQPAVEKGLEIVGPKMADFARQALHHARENQLLVHCWRGGMRSESMAWLFDKVGINCSLLEGGYKAYRNFLLDYMGSFQNILVVEGHTGSGKTAILTEIENQGQQMLDLEGYAHHKGSVFGGIGQAPQPTSQQFQNNLLEKALLFDQQKVVWVEGESKSIGRAFLPDSFWNGMVKAEVFQVVMPRSCRVQRLVKEYGLLDPEAMEFAIEKLTKRLGNRVKDEILSLYRENDLAKVADLLLDYYDKSYQFGRDKLEKKRHTIELNQDDASQNAQRLLAEAVALNLPV